MTDMALKRLKGYEDPAWGVKLAQDFSVKGTKTLLGARSSSRASE